MSDIQSRPQDGEALAYVLNLMGPSEKRAFEAALLDDPDLADEVWQLEEALSPLADALTPRRPSRQMSRAVVERLFPERVRVRTRPSAIFQLATDTFFAATVVAATFIAVVISQPTLLAPAEGPERQLIAGVPLGDAGEAVLLVRQVGDDMLVLSAIPSADPAHSHQAWLVANDGAAHSIGLVPENEPQRIELTDDVRRLLAEGVRIIVTVEPPGGSPTNEPTGPVAGTAELRSI